MLSGGACCQGAARLQSAHVLLPVGGAVQPQQLLGRLDGLGVRPAPHVLPDLQALAVQLLRTRLVGVGLGVRVMVRVMVMVNNGVGVSALSP